jgi:hypothetical protein
MRLIIFLLVRGNITKEREMDQQQRIKADWDKASQGNLQVIVHDDCIFAYGTELECLRLFHYYKGNEKTQTWFSKNLNTWIFKLERKI